MNKKISRDMIVDVKDSAEINDKGILIKLSDFFISCNFKKLLH